MVYDDKKNSGDFYEVDYIIHQDEDGDTVVLDKEELQQQIQEEEIENIKEEIRESGGYVEDSNSDNTDNDNDDYDCRSNPGKMPLHLLAIQQNYMNQFGR
ncbi:MAG: hypothetical protein FWG39_01960 [Alphaproteobacteria bacterium]|nr:hypothetical protein [Alphaproteobacteria bacterium]